LKGIIEKKITNMFEPRRAKSFGWQLYEFDSGYQEAVYVVAGAVFKEGTEIDSIGLFSHANLKSQMADRLGYILKAEYDQYSNKDSMIAYIVNDKMEMYYGIMKRRREPMSYLDIINH